MKKALFNLISICLLCAACNSKAKNEIAEKEDYKKAEETLLAKEKKNPVRFLSVESKDKHNLIGQTVVKGTITSRAKVCVYYDVQLELSFISKTGTLLMKTDETVLEVVEPGKSVDFKTKDFAPKGTDSVAVKITAAKTK